MTSAGDLPSAEVRPLAVGTTVETAAAAPAKKERENLHLKHRAELQRLQEKIKKVQAITVPEAKKKEISAVTGELGALKEAVDKDEKISLQKYNSADKKDTESRKALHDDWHDLHTVNEDITKTHLQATNVTYRYFGPAIAAIGGGLAWMGGGLADTGEAIWKVGLGPFFAKIGRMSEQPRAAMAESLRNSKFIPFGLGPVLANLIHKAPAPVVPKTAEQVALEAKAFDQHKNFTDAINMVSAAAKTKVIEISTLEPAQYANMLSELRGGHAVYQKNNAGTTWETYLVTLGETMAKQPGFKTATTWQEFMMKVQGLTLPAQGAPAPRPAPAVIPAPIVPNPVF